MLAQIQDQFSEETINKYIDISIVPQFKPTAKTCVLLKLLIAKLNEKQIYADFSQNRSCKCAMMK